MVSVIVPTYNRQNTISRAVLSVLNQSYGDLEIIIVDDCSTDNTEEVVKNIRDKRIHYVRHKTNQGACAARNTGILLAKGEYIAFQDSDDVWQEDKLQIQLDKMKEYNADICFCRLHRHGFPQNMDEFVPDLKTGIVPYETLLTKFVASTQTIIGERSVVRNNLFDVNVKRLQDYDWMIRAGENQKVIFVGDAIVDTYWQNDSITNSGDEVLLSTNRYFLKKYADKTDKYPAFEIFLLKRIISIESKLNMDASKDCWEAFKLQRDFKSFVKWGLSKIGLLNWATKVVNKY